MLLKGDTIWNYDFESVSVTSIGKSDDKNEVIVSMLIQFSNASIQKDDFIPIWKSIIQTEESMNGFIKNETNTTKHVDTCPELLTLKLKMPPEIWTASNLEENQTLQVKAHQKWQKITKFNFKIPSQKRWANRST